MSKKMLELAKSQEAKLDMTSMIDVVFLLLIFFMCATKFKNPEGTLRAYLPRDRGGDSISSAINRGCRITLGRVDKEILLMIDDKMISFDVDDPLGGKNWFEREWQYNGGYAPNEDELLEHLQMRKDNYEIEGGLGDKGLPVIVDFSKNVPSKYVVQILNLCHEAKIVDISFAQPEIPIE